EFDFAKVTEQSKDNPVFYVQYAHARAASVMRHAAELLPGSRLDDAALAGASLARLDDPLELALIRLLASWPRIVESAAAAHDSPELIGEDRGDEYYRPQRRWPAGLLTLGAMVVFAGGLYFAYVQGTRHPAVTPTADGVPLIRADERPTKVKPDQPGGMAVPD